MPSGGLGEEDPLDQAGLVLVPGEVGRMATLHGWVDLKPRPLSQALHVVSRCFLSSPKAAPDIPPRLREGQPPHEEAGDRPGFLLGSPFCLVTVQGPDPPLLPHGRGPTGATTPLMQEPLVGLWASSPL